MHHGAPEQRADERRAARKRVARVRHGEWEPAPGRADPVGVLEAEGVTRVPELLPIRYGRMSASPFAFYRGAAAVMAADLAREPHTGLEVQLCGDAHFSNFGGFASPDREMVFDVNDFDETIPGPFEWDVKRLAASIEVAGRDLGTAPRARAALVRSCVASYRRAMAGFAAQRTLDVWYARLDGAALVARWGEEAGRAVLGNFERSVTRARSKDHLRALAKLTTEVDGRLQFVEDPPLMVRAADLLAETTLEYTLRDLFATRSQYRATLSGDRRHLLDRYEIVDLARKVVGVGSVGTRCWVALFVGRDQGDPLLLQVKEAERAVAEPYLRPSLFPNQGQRVVEGQRLMQSASDIFLGWDRLVGDDGVARDFYMRQLWDWKLSADLETMLPEGLAVYVQMCGWTLARAHARSGDAVAISAYLGGSDRFDRALAAFAVAYADQNERDAADLARAVATGRVPCDREH